MWYHRRAEQPGRKNKFLIFPISADYAAGRIAPEGIAGASGLPRLDIIEEPNSPQADDKVLSDPKPQSAKPVHPIVTLKGDAL